MSQGLQGRCEQVEDFVAQLRRWMEDAALAVQLVLVSSSDWGRQLLGSHSVARQHGKGLDVKGEAGGGPLRPSARGRRRGQTVEAGVDLDGVKMAGVVAESVRGGAHGRGVPGPHHGRVGPGTRAYADSSVHR